MSKHENSHEQIWDVIVIGSSVAGASAAIYLSRYGLKVLVLDKGPCMLKHCPILYNYPGYPAGIGIDRFLSILKEQVQYEGGVLKKEKAKSILRTNDDKFQVSTEQEGTYLATRVIAATTPNVKYLSELKDKEDQTIVN